MPIIVVNAASAARGGTADAAQPSMREHFRATIGRRHIYGSAKARCRYRHAHAQQDDD